MGNHLTHGPRTRALQRRRVDASLRSSEKPRCSRRAPMGTTETGTESRAWRAGRSIPSALEESLDVRPHGRGARELLGDVLS